MRHADTAERRHRAGPPRELLADNDGDDEVKAEQHTREGTFEHDELDPTQNFLDEDSME
jgi:hypothetical protein